ncbi:DUF3300 domain-containing protein [Paraburkholderia phenazinium]|uniref:DUF3300 domain-containing protein n=1 Tax=Paraburkholderia phenazinium TaxID=60549 RepID=A0A1G8JSR4_9BURK|nr:DUF3300 domain-containing protein [Paraburkholderia phenazinium]SDI34171.1 Protein of unknown function [Paraburkholderia phenazinium]
MKITAVQTIVMATLGVALFAFGALAQTPPQAPAQALEAAPAPSTAALAPAALDQMLAPIALYPDPLIAQILMAATYPLEIVEAHRWLQDPNNAALSGNSLATALTSQPWDPSVKSLVAFPQILAMMDGNLEWTERLGDTFLADQAAVSNAIQRLRQTAAAAGTLNTTQQQVVTTTPEEITIEPAMPDVVYVPVYDPELIYGVWPYPGFPPYYFPGYFDGVIVSGIGFGWIGVTVIAPLWGWCRWDWPRHHIDIDRGRFGELNGHHVPPTGVWQHDPDHRHGVPYRNPQVQARYAASARVPKATRELRGFPVAGTPAERGAAPSDAAGVHTVVPRAPVSTEPRVPPVFESFGNGANVRAQAERGRESRMTMPSFHQATPQRGMPSGGGGRYAPSGGGRGQR